MATLTPAQIYALNKQVADANGGASTQHLIEATFVVLRESGGVTDITNVVDSGESKGSIDRGLWQFNSKWHPDVSDAIAFDPLQATQKAWQKSDGFKNWETWKFTSGGKSYLGRPDDSDTQKAKWKQAAEASWNAGDIDLTDITDPAGAVIDKTLDVVSSVTPAWMDSLAKMLSKLISVDFWKRVGIVTVGSLILVIALLLLFREEATETVKDVVT